MPKLTSEEKKEMKTEKREEKKKNMETQAQNEAAKRRSCTTFNDIAGYDDVKQTLLDKVNYVFYPELIQSGERKPGNIGLLLYGAKGTGKALFAEALANEIDMSLHRCKAGDVLESPLLGASAKYMREFTEEILTDESRRIMILVEDFDALLCNDGGSAFEIERERAVAELLCGIDAVIKADENRLIVFAVVLESPWLIDPASPLARWLDTPVYIGLPDKPARRELVRNGLGGVLPLADDVDLCKLADSLRGYTGADITAICRKISDENDSRQSHIGQRSCVTMEDIGKVLACQLPGVSGADMRRYDHYNKMRGIKTPYLT